MGPIAVKALHENSKTTRVAIDAVAMPPGNLSKLLYFIDTLCHHVASIDTSKICVDKNWKYRHGIQPG